ncbi:hypothetical protein PAEPH01_2547, partial [Pancytospora epiphaga]
LSINLFLKHCNNLLSFHWFSSERILNIFHFIILLSQIMNWPYPQPRCTTSRIKKPIGFKDPPKLYLCRYSHKITSLVYVQETIRTFVWHIFVTKVERNFPELVCIDCNATVKDGAIEICRNCGVGTDMPHAGFLPCEVCGKEDWESY